MNGPKRCGAWQACLAGAVALVSGCSEAAPEFDTTLSTKDVMRHVIDPAAIALWGRAGTMDTEDGTVYLTPDTEEEWAAAENEATIVAEGGNLLLFAPRIVQLEKGDMGWSDYARQMTQAAIAVKTATAARDAEAMFTTGGKLYEVCTACHETYYIPFLEDGEMPAPEAPTKTKK